MSRWTEPWAGVPYKLPFGPGIEDVRVNRTELTDDGAVYEVEIVGHGTHFTTSEPRVFLRRGDNVKSATAIKAPPACKGGQRQRRHGVLLVVFLVFIFLIQRIQVHVFYGR